MDVGNQLVGSVDHLEAADRHVLAQFGDDGFAFCFNQFAQFFNGSRFFLGSGFRNEVGEFYEACVFGNEVGFAVYFNQCADIAIDGVSQYAFGSGTAGQFARFRAGFDAQDFFGFFEIAFCFNQCFFAFHHAQTGGGAQVGNHFCCNFSHVLSPIIKVSGRLKGFQTACRANGFIRQQQRPVQLLRFRPELGFYLPEPRRRCLGSTGGWLWLSRRCPG